VTRLLAEPSHRRGDRIDGGVGDEALLRKVRELKLAPPGERVVARQRHEAGLTRDDLDLDLCLAGQEPGERYVNPTGQELVESVQKQFPHGHLDIWVGGAERAEQPGE
jgi:hypothetical protein